MERLLVRAEELQAAQGNYVDYSIDSFADVIQAIHDVQTDLGITGTTADEAGRTISGSFAAAKAAFQNFITGLSDSNADIGSLIDNVITSIVGDGSEENRGVLGNLMPVIETALSGVSDLIKGLAPIIAESIPVLITDILPSLVEGAVTLISELTNAIIENADSILQTALDAMKIILVDGFGVSAEDATRAVDGIKAAFESVGNMIQFAIDNANTIIPIMAVVAGAIGTITAAIGLYNTTMAIKAAMDAAQVTTIGGLISATWAQVTAQAALLAPYVAITAAIGALIAVIVLCVKHWDEIKKAGANAWEAIKKAWQSVSIWFSDNVTQPIKRHFSTLWDNIKGIFSGVKGWFTNVGSDLLTGIWNGISDKVAWLKGKVSGVVDTIKGWFTDSDGFDTHSPSKWSEKVFRYVMDGGGKGLEAGLPSLMRDVENVTDKVKNGMQFDISGVNYKGSGRNKLSNQITAINYGENLAPINIVVQSVLDGKVIGETAYQYSKNKQRAYGV